MTIAEMHTACDIELDKANSPWFSPSEKDYFSNEAQIEYVKQRYEEFELDERVRMALIPLVRSVNGSNTSEINLSSIQGYLFTLNLRAEFNKLCGNGTSWEKVSPIQLDDEGENQNDPFNKNDDSNPGYTTENDGTNNLIKVISDNPMLNYVLKYLLFPPNVSLDPNNPANNVNSIMPEFTHQEIVNLAVRSMLATTEQQLNYQLHTNEINNQN